jgi:P-type Cu+ transporter
MSSTVDLAIGGMTCASCASRIERRLNRLDGVAASVNFATGTARVVHPSSVELPVIVSTVESLGYSAATARTAELHGRAHPGRWVLLCAVLGVVVLGLGMLPGLRYPGWAFTSLGLSAIVVGAGGWPFHRAAVRALRHGSTTMDTLVSLGSLVSFGWSAAVVLRAAVSSAPLYFEVATTLVTFLLLGRWFEALGQRRAGSALRALAELGAQEAARLGPDGREEQVPVGDLRIGDRFVVRPGEKVATDGVVVLGTSAIDASLLTGESRPVEVGPGDPVTGATVNVGGRLVVEVGRIGADTALAQISRLVLSAQSGKAPVQRLADRISAVFVPLVLVAAVLTFAGWLVAGRPVGVALGIAVAVLVVACPCALGLATPTALLVGTGRGAQLGLLIRGPQVLESTRRIDTVLLDKTGTVTSGALTVTAVTPGPGESRADLLRLAGAVEHAAEHPIARAVAAQARAESTVDELDAVEDFVALPGLGARGRVDGHDVIVGQTRLLSAEGIALPASRGTAGGDIQVAWDGQWRGSITAADPVTPTSVEAVARLRALGLRPVLLTGDTAEVARAVAAAVGIDEVIAGVSPAGKVDAVRRLQAGGATVAMVGDGVNDAAALAAADLGIAMGSGADVAIEASDLTIVRAAGAVADLRAAADAVALARATLATIRANLFWAFAYNVAMLPLAAAGFVAPVLAGAAMALSSVLVVANSLRLFRFRPAGSVRVEP